jgi:hypothetical protein
VAGNVDFNGDLDVDGTTNLDAVDIDGAVQVDSTITVGADDTGYDVKFFGDTASAYMLWDTSTDDLVLAGAAGIDLAGDLDVDGTTNLDVVDIDGAVDMASTLGVSGATTLAAATLSGNLEVAKAAAKVIVDSSSAASVDIDRSATDQNATVDFQTAGSSNWAIGLRDSDDWGDGTSFMFGTGSSAANTKMVIDTAGNVLIGKVTPASQMGIEPHFQLEGQGHGPSTLSTFRNTNDASPSYITLGKSRGTASNANTIVADDDEIGQIAWIAADGTDRTSRCASISAFIDGTPGANDTPGRLVFSTAADGAQVATARMTIAQDGKVGIGTNLSKEVNFSNGPNGVENCLHFEAATDTKWSMYGYDRTNSHYTDLSLNGSAIYIEGGGTRQVGINETSPDNQLHVTAANSGPALIEATAGNASYLMFKDNTSSGVNVRVGSIGDHLSLWAGDGERVRINSNGHIGVPSTTRIYLDDLDLGGDTYIVHSASNLFDVVTSGVLGLRIDGNGDVDIPNGALSKQSGSFKIDHPLPDKKDTHHLVHSFIEGPQADLVYRGTVDLSGGWAQVDLDDAAGMTEGTWELLCRDAQCWIQNDSGWDAVRGSVEGNMLTIECAESDSGDTVSWLVVAERCDPHMYDTGWTDDDGHVIVEPEKPEEEE